MNNKTGRVVLLILALAASEPVLLSQNWAHADPVWLVGSQLSQIEASGNNVYVLWQNNSPEENVYFRRSTDNGVTFGNVIPLGDVASTGSATGPRMAVSGDNVYAAWMDRRINDDYKVLFRRSVDGGATFEKPQALSDNEKGPAGLFYLAASGNNIYAAIIDEWAEKGSYYYDLKLRVSRDNGKTFGEPVSVLPDLSQWNVGAISSITIFPHEEGDVIYAVGVDYANCSPIEASCGADATIFFRKSEDGGRTFSPPLTIERPAEAFIVPDGLNVQHPMWLQVASDETHISIIWEERIFSEFLPALFLARSSDEGESFDGPVGLEHGKGNPDSPYIFSNQDSTFVAWNDRPSDPSYPHIALTKLGEDSFEPVNVSGRIMIPYWDTAVSQKDVFVAWNNHTKNTSGLPDGTDVYFAASTDEGTSFGKPINLSDDNAIKMLFATQQKPLSFVSPQIAVSDAHVYVAWTASYPDSHEIFLRASSDGGRTFGGIVSLNDEQLDPFSRTFLILTSSSAIYLIMAVTGVVAASFGILFVARRRPGNR